MRTFSFLFLTLLLFIFPSCIAETVLWEDENGSVLLDENGEINFISVDGSVSSSVLETFSTVTPVFPSEPEESFLPYDENDLPEVTPAPTEVVPEPTAASVSGLLRYGDSGDAVARLQTRLAELGYYSAKVTGGYYKVTQSAVRAFQKQNGLLVDGIAGRKTQECLFSDTAVPASAAPVTATAPTAKYLLAVDITNQITRAYTYDEQGNYSVLVREMICSTGTTKNPTPLGTTVMPKSRARWGYFPTWGSHAQYLTRIDSANAFHSVLYSHPNEKSLATSSFDALGTRQSHGCVRLTVSDAKWIYDNCEAGTLITVYESDVYDPEYTMTLKPTLNVQTLRENPLPEPTPYPVYAPENWPKSYRTLRNGSTGQDVFMVQMRLAELGYYHGSITGGYYGGTAAAVKAFQKDNGLSVDGMAGKQTQSILFGQSGDMPSDSPLPEPTPTPSPSPAPTSTPTVEPGSIAPFSETVG